jgi:hypothetical protein
MMKLRGEEHDIERDIARRRINTFFFWLGRIGLKIGFYFLYESIFLL